jgi:hypothetical protein
MNKHIDQLTILEPRNQKERVIHFSEQALIDKKATTAENKITRHELYESARKLSRLSTKDFPENTFSIYIGVAINNRETKIAREAGKNGYYFNEQANLESLLETEEKQGKLKKRKLEEPLYLVFKDWLLARSYRTDVTAGMTILGPWGNPDVTGIMTTTVFNSIRLEIATIEVKASFDNWERVLFEAVSHRRFANRAYFAFSAQKDSLNSRDEELLRFYSETFGIGILVFEVERRDFEKINTGKYKANDDSFELIRELSIAPFHETSPRYQKEFLDALKIGDNQEKLYSWGSAVVSDDE